MAGGNSGTPKGLPAPLLRKHGVRTFGLLLCFFKRFARVVVTTLAFKDSVHLSVTFFH